MRSIVVGAGVVLALATSAAAQQLPIEGRPVECANDALTILVESDPNPQIPVHGLGLAVWFLGCSPDPTPVAVPILGAVQDDIEILHRYRDELPNIGQEVRAAVCRAWWSIYRNEYDWALYQYGSDLVGGFPTPAERWTDCERWIGSSPARGR